jgi:VanZ family protein
MVRKNILSVCIAVVIVFLSFTGAGTFSRLHLPAIPYLDKLVHGIMYFTLMFALIIENRSQLDSAKSYLFLATIPAFFGALIEVLQSMFTTSRSGDILDFCADASGIVLSVFVWIVIKRFMKKEVR